jgi:hypothetical protein
MRTTDNPPSTDTSIWTWRGALYEAGRFGLTMLLVYFSADYLTRTGWSDLVCLFVPTGLAIILFLLLERR